MSRIINALAMRPDISKYMMTEVDLDMDKQRKWFENYKPLIHKFDG